MTFYQLLEHHYERKKKIECQCIQYGSTNWENYFYVSYWRWDCHFRWSSKPLEGLTICRAKAVPSFLSHFKNLSVGLTSGIEPSTSRSAVKHSTN